MTPPASRGKSRPIGAELELHGDAGDDPHHERDAKDLRPKAHGAIVVGVSRAKREGLQHEDQEREPHRELRKQIVIGDGEREMQPMEGERVHA